MTFRIPIRLTLAAVTIAAYSGLLWAQGGTQSPGPRYTMIRGVVRDHDTHEGLQHIVVTLDRQDSGFAGQAETDSSGKFTFQAPGQEVFVIRVKPPGYREETQRIDLRVMGTDYVTLEPRRIEKAGAAPPEGTIPAKDAAVPENARKEFQKGQELLLTKKDVQGTIDHLRKATKIYPAYSDAYVLMAMAYMEDNNEGQAKASLQKALEVDPNSASANFTMGMLANQGKDYATAEKSLLHGLEVEPNAPQGHYELAKTYWAMNRWQEAAPHAEKAAQLKPDMAAVHVLLGNISLRKQDGAGAAKEFQEYLRLEPNGPMAPGVKQMLERLQASGNQSK